MYTDKELQAKVEDSLLTLLCLNPREAINMFIKGKRIDFNYLLNNLHLPIDLEDSSIRECLNRCIFNPSVALISFVEFDDPYKHCDDSIRPIYHCFLNETNQSFYFSVFIPYDYEIDLKENLSLLIKLISMDSSLVKKVYIPEWDYVET